MLANEDEFGDVVAEKSVTVGGTVGVHHERVGVSASIVHHEPLDDASGFMTFDAAVDVVVTHRMRAFLAYGYTTFDSDAQSIGAGVRIWR